MAKNIGGGRRGAIRGRTQFKLPSGHYAKRDSKTGDILSVKADLKPYKGVVIERPQRSPISQAPLVANTRMERATYPALDRPVWRARTQAVVEKRSSALPEPAPHQ